jgi:hypothetical protein
VTPAPGERIHHFDRPVVDDLTTDEIHRLDPLQRIRRGLVGDAVESVLQLGVLVAAVTSDGEVCEDCGEVFDSSQALSAHVSVHAD